MSAAEDVKQELQALKDLGVGITENMLAYPEANAAEMQEFRDNGMKISEIADYVISIAL